MGKKEEEEEIVESVDVTVVVDDGANMLFIESHIVSSSNCVTYKKPSRLKSDGSVNVASNGTGSKNDQFNEGNDEVSNAGA